MIKSHTLPCDYYFKQKCTRPYLVILLRFSWKLSCSTVPFIVVSAVADKAVIVKLSECLSREWLAPATTMLPQGPLHNGNVMTKLLYTIHTR